MKVLAFIEPPQTTEASNPNIEIRKKFKM